MNYLIFLLLLLITSCYSNGTHEVIDSLIELNGAQNTSIRLNFKISNCNANYIRTNNRQSWEQCISSIKTLQDI